MNISITGPSGLATDQVRAYAEYRVFSALARYGRLIRSAAVDLEPGGGLNARVTCAIDVTLTDGEPVQCRSTQPHVIDSIDRAAERVRRSLDRRTRQAVSS